MYTHIHICKTYVYLVCTSQLGGGGGASTGAREQSTGSVLPSAGGPGEGGRRRHWTGALPPAPAPPPPLPPLPPPPFRRGPPCAARPCPPWWRTESSGTRRTSASAVVRPGPERGGRCSHRAGVCDTRAWRGCVRRAGRRRGRGPAGARQPRLVRRPGETRVRRRAPAPTAQDPRRQYICHHCIQGNLPSASCSPLLCERPHDRAVRTMSGILSTICCPRLPGSLDTVARLLFTGFEEQP